MCTGARALLRVAPLLVAALVLFGCAALFSQPPCEVPDNGTGTVDLPPPGCGYVSPADLHVMIDGLPPGTTINVSAEHAEFFNPQVIPGGSLGGEIEIFDSMLILNMQGTGALAGFQRFITVPVLCEVHTGPRTPGTPVQTFPNEMIMLEGGIFGDPDFDQLNITAGTGFGLPSPGQTTLTQLPTGNWNVDSFFDITYQIDFVGAPGSVLDGHAGSTIANVAMQTGIPATPTVPPCTVPDNGTGTVDLPPQGCGYVSPADLHVMIDGLPPGTTINVSAEHTKFFNPQVIPGGTLGGEVELFDSQLLLNMQGTGLLAGFQRFIGVPVLCQVHTGPRTPGDPVQTFPNDMFMLQGEIFGDPDFDLLRVTAGTQFGLPSPGQTTLTQLPTGDWNVDSFFDITYRIEFQGAPGSILEGFGGLTTDTVAMQTGNPIVIIGPPGDDCANAIPVGDGDFDTITLGANTDGPAPCGSLGSDIWLLYTASCAGTVRASNCNQADYDSVIAVYPATAACPPDAASAIACNDDGGGCGLTSTVVFRANPGDQFLIQLGGFSGAQGAGILSIECFPDPPPCPPTTATLTHSATQTILPGNSVSCNAGGIHAENSYWRSFTPCDDPFNTNDEVLVTSVEFGVQASVPGSGTILQPVNVRLWLDPDGGSPAPVAGLQLLAQQPIDIPSMLGGMVCVPFLNPILVPCDSTLVLEINTPDGFALGNSFQIGSNQDGETGPSYVSSAEPACGILEPTEVSLLGFINHYVMNVHYDVAGVCPCGGPVRIINPGADAWHTPSGGTSSVGFGTPDVPPIPADFFFPGSDPFTGTVALEGNSLTDLSGNNIDLTGIDTIVERLAPATLTGPGSSATIPIEIVALDLKSVSPIIVTGSGSGFEYDLRVVLSDAPQAIGEMTINDECADGGSFNALLPVSWKAIFTPLLGGPEMVFDAGTNLGPSLFTSFGVPWLQAPIDPTLPVLTLPPGVQVDANADGTAEPPLPGSTGNFTVGIEPVPCDPTTPPGGSQQVQVPFSCHEGPSPEHPHCVGTPRFCPEPSGLVCISDCVTGEIVVTWVNSSTVPYVGITVEVVDAGGVVVFGVSLPGTATSVVIPGLPAGHYSITINAECIAGAGTGSAACELLHSPYAGQTNLIWAPPDQAGGLTDSAAELAAAFDAIGKDHLLIESLDYPCLDQIAGTENAVLWAILGTFPDNHGLDPAEGAALVTLLSADVSIYIEGGDVWGFDAPTSFADHDGVDGGSLDGNVADDGDDTFQGMIGGAHESVDVTGLDALYNQDQAGSDWTDQIAPTGTGFPPDIPGGNAGVIWSDDGSGGSTVTYDTGIFYKTDLGFGDVIAQSWEFGGYGGDQLLLAGIYSTALKLPDIVEPEFVRGDCNVDGLFDIGDPISLLAFLFSSGTPPSCDDSCDSNDDGGIDIGDAINILATLFSGGALPPLPHPFCGVDPTVDALGCASYPPCP